VDCIEVTNVGEDEYGGNVHPFVFVTTHTAGSQFVQVLRRLYNMVTVVPHFVQLLQRL
jgi:hypothetical protein